MAGAPIRLLAWEFPYATGTALKRKKKKMSFLELPVAQQLKDLVFSLLWLRLLLLAQELLQAVSTAKYVNK